MATPVLDTNQSLIQHLDELRSRLLICLASFFLLSIGGYFGVDPVLEWLAQPVGRFIFTRPTDALFVRFKIACSLGLLASVPIFLYQAWRFIEVALLDKERTLVKVLVPAASVLFYLGTAAAVLVVAPKATHFLLQFQSSQLTAFISIQTYLSFIVWMVLGFGLLFQLPLVVFVLCWSGLTQVDTIKQYRRHTVVGLLILAAVLSPGPDIFSQLLLAVLSYLLFEISLLLAGFLRRK